LTETQLVVLYVFDASVVAVLAAEFADRARRGGRKYLLRNSYEVLALFPVVYFTALEQSPVIGAALRGLRLLRLLRIVMLTVRGLRALRMLSAYSREARLFFASPRLTEAIGVYGVLGILTVSMCMDSPVPSFLLRAPCLSSRLGSSLSDMVVGYMVPTFIDGPSGCVQNKILPNTVVPGGDIHSS